MRSPREPRLALNTVCPYYTMFPIEFPLRQLQRANSGDVVLDPFCGRGTTLYAARLQGLHAVGVDSNPVAAAIAAAKLITVSSHRVVQVATRMLNDTTPQDIPLGDFWSLCYHSDTLRDICKLRVALRSGTETVGKIALRALVLGALHGPVNKGDATYFSNQMPRTYAAKPDYAVRFWLRRRDKPRKIDVLDVLKRRASHYFDVSIPRGSGSVHCADSRMFPWGPRRANWIVTSPPYYGMRTYVPDQWLRHWFLGGPADVQYRFKDQLSHESPEEFSSQLAKIWANIAKACAPQARMIIRFGGIRDRNAQPTELLLESIRIASAGWKIATIRSAGQATLGKRQADQFRRILKTPLEEHDFHLILAT